MKHNICPLTGQPCSKPKIYQITEIEDNKAKTVVSLCEDCFAIYVNQKPKVDEKIAKEFVNEVLSFVETIVKEYNPTPKLSKSCPKCGTSLHDISKKGKLGCIECWDWFYEDIKTALYLAHGSPNSPEDLIHTGKVPKNFHVTKIDEDAKTRMVKLKYKLSQAIEQEDYEKAAKLRDIIKDLESLDA
jgi:protein arginine kinase activator